MTFDNIAGSLPLSVLEQYALAPSAAKRLELVQTHATHDSTEYYLLQLLAMMAHDAQVAREHGGATSATSAAGTALPYAAQRAALVESFLAHYSYMDEVKLRNDIFDFFSSTPEKQATIFDDIIRRFGLEQHYERPESATHGSDDSVSSSAPALPTRYDDSELRNTDALLTKHVHSIRNSSSSSSSPYVASWYATYLHANAPTLKDGPELVRAFLTSLRSPTVPKLVSLVAFDMTSNKIAFGERVIHTALTTQQLERLAKKNTALTRDLAYTREMLRRQHSLVDLKQLDAAAKREWYESQWAYALTLDHRDAPVLLPLKALIMYHVLNYYASIDQFDLAKFDAYLALPRAPTAPFKTPSSPADAAAAASRFADPAVPRVYFDSRLEPPYSSLKRGACPSSGHGLGHFADVESDAALLISYVRESFRHHASDDKAAVDRFANHFEMPWLLEQLARQRLAAQPDPSVDMGTHVQRLGADEARRLREQVVLRFPVSNPTEFVPGQPVEISVEVKNAPSVLVRVFPINAREYFKSTGRPLDVDIELDGLNAHEEFTLPIDGSVSSASSTASSSSLSVSPYYLARKTIRLPSLQHARGSFIVEVLASGQRARALLHLGSLWFVTRSSTRGVLLALIDERQQPVAGGVWFQGVEYTSDAHNVIVLPFRSPASSSSNPTPLSSTSHMVLSSVDAQGHAVAALVPHFSAPVETVSFTARMAIDRESLLSKTTSEVVIHASLLINGQRADLSLLRQPSLRIELTTHDGVVSTQTAESSALSFARDRETVYPFRVPDHLRSVQLTLSARVLCASSGELRDVSASESIEVDTNDHASSIESLHLRYGAEGYAVYALGQTGEPLPARAVDVTLTHELLRAPIDVSLQTDTHGCVVLGELPLIRSLSAKLLANSASPLHAKWELAPRAAQVAPPLIHARAGSSSPIDVPYMRSALDTDLGADDAATTVIRGDAVSTYVALLQVDTMPSFDPSQSGSLSDASYRADVTSQYVSILGGVLPIVRIDAQQLPAGSYVLFWKRSAQNPTRLIVVRGSPILNEFVLTRQSVVQLSPTAQQPRVARVERMTSGAVRVHVANATPSTRVHFVSTFFDQAPDSLSALLDSSIAEVTAEPLVPTRSRYSLQSAIGDEHQYVLDRRTARKRAGNMLSRPSLLVQPRELGVTTFSSDPTLRRAAAVQARADEVAGMARQNMRMSMNRVDRIDAELHGQERMLAGLGTSLSTSGSRSYASRKVSEHYVSSREQGSVPREFLRAASTRVWNLKPDAQTGIVEIAADLVDPHHSTATIVLVDGTFAGCYVRFALGSVVAPEPASSSSVSSSSSSSSSSTALAPLTALHPAFRDLRVLSALPSASHFTEQRIVSLLRPDETLVIDDMPSATLSVFDSLSDVWSLLQVANSYDRSVASTMTSFNWLLRWPTLSDHEKALKYDEFASHELNVFVYAKDRAFFDRVARPCVASKLHKTFVDKWLLGANLASYTQPAQLARLHTFERLLLAQRVASVNKALAVAILQDVKNRAALLTPDRENDRRRFHAALLVKSVEARDRNETDGGRDRDHDRDRRRMGKGSARTAGYDMDDGTESDESTADLGGGGMFDDGVPRPKMRMAAPMAAPMAARAAPMMMMASFGGMPGVASAPPPPPPAPASFSFDEYERVAPAAPRPVFQAPAKTKEYEERTYWNVRRTSHLDSSHMIPVNRFWADYASHLERAFDAASSASSSNSNSNNSPFLSIHVADASSSFSEVIFALSVLDMPFASGVKQPAMSGLRERTFRLTAATPLIAFRKEMRSTSVRDPLVVSVVQQYLEVSDDGSGDANGGGGGGGGDQTGEDANGDMDGDDDDDGSEPERFVREFVPLRVYQSRAILSNPTSRRMHVEIHYQLPQGSIPIVEAHERATATRSKFVEIEPFATALESTLFYFPAVGRFVHAPLQVSRKGAVLGHGADKTIAVGAKRERAPNPNSWLFLSEQASNDELYAYLAAPTTNLHKLDLHRMAWRLHDKAFCLRVLELFRARSFFFDVAYRFGVMHHDVAALREVLPTLINDASVLGPHFESALIRVDGEDNQFDVYQHLEYSPLLNSRAHPLRGMEQGGARDSATNTLFIQNVELNNQYKRFLMFLAHRFAHGGAIDASHRLALTYYLLLQDRIDEALESFEQIRADDVAADAASLDAGMRVLYDYMAAYLAMFAPEGGSQRALAVTDRYVEYPVVKRRKLFEQIREQVLEAEGFEDGANGASGAVGTDASSTSQGSLPTRDQRMESLVNTEPSVDFTVDTGAAVPTIVLQHQNVGKVTINFFTMDVELLFSSNPFLTSSSSSSSASSSASSDASSSSSSSEDMSKLLFVRPNHSVVLSVGDNAMQQHQQTRVPLPESLRVANVFIEVQATGAGASSSIVRRVVKPHYHNDLSVQVVSAYGQVKVVSRTTQRPIAQAYVKVYAKSKSSNGDVSFYKDGYTDLRGRFDYVSLSTDRLGTVKEFAVLIVSETGGAIVKRCEPPSSSGTV